MSLKSLEEPDEDRLEKRGEGRRYALILAGLELFAELGLEATSTRMLAQRAGANVAAIPYYFGSKEGLYHAVIEHIAEQVGEHMGTVSRNVGAFLEKKPVDREAARRAFHELWRAMALMFVDSEQPKAWTRVIMREKSYPTEAFEIFYNHQIKPMQRMGAELMGIYTGRSPEDEEIKVRVHALACSILGFLFDRASLLRVLDVASLGERHISLILAILDQITEACLNLEPVVLNERYSDEKD